MTAGGALILLAGVLARRTGFFKYDTKDNGKEQRDAWRKNVLWLAGIGATVLFGGIAQGFLKSGDQGAAETTPQVDNTEASVAEANTDTDQLGGSGSSIAAAVPLNDLPGLDNVVPDAVVQGAPHPGALAWRLDQAGCESSQRTASTPLPSFARQLSATVALSDDSPDDANVVVALKANGPEQAVTALLGKDQQAVSIDLSVSGELVMRFETLSAFGMSCGSLPVTVLIFNGVVR